MTAPDTAALAPGTRITARTLGPACVLLADQCRFMARAHAEAGTPKLRHRRPGFETLLRAILAQQVSVASARAITARVEAAFDPLTPEAVLIADQASLRGLGLSRQKARYAHDLAAAVVERRLRLDRLARMDDEDAIAALTEVRGIGRWTAEVYLLFALRRPDIWPVDDLAVVESARRVMGLEERPDRKAMLAIGETWRPWRSVAARLLWHHYNIVVV